MLPCRIIKFISMGFGENNADIISSVSYKRNSRLEQPPSYLPNGTGIHVSCELRCFTTALLDNIVLIEYHSPSYRRFWIFESVNTAKPDLELSSRKLNAEDLRLIGLKFLIWLDQNCRAEISVYICTPLAQSVSRKWCKVANVFWWCLLPY